MEEELRRAMRPIYHAGLEVKLIKEIIPNLKLEDLRSIESLCKRHKDRVTAVWRVKDSSGFIRRTPITKLTDGRLYLILRGNYDRSLHIRKALRLEAEMRGILVNGKLKDPSIDTGPRSLPPGLLEQCG